MATNTVRLNDKWGSKLELNLIPYSGFWLKLIRRSWVYGSKSVSNWLGRSSTQGKEQVHIGTYRKSENECKTRLELRHDAHAFTSASNGCDAVARDDESSNGTLLLKSSTNERSR
jgi:hypothetical protein